MPPFCWKSKNQQVFGESLGTFFSSESTRGRGGRNPTQKTHSPKRVQNSATIEPFSYKGKLSIQFPCLLRYATKKVENTAFMA